MQPRRPIMSGYLKNKSNKAWN